MQGEAVGVGAFLGSSSSSGSSGNSGGSGFPVGEGLLPLLRPVLLASMSTSLVASRLHKPYAGPQSEPEGQPVVVSQNCLKV